MSSVSELIISKNRSALFEHIFSVMSHKLNNISQSVLLSAQVLHEVWGDLAPLVEQYYESHGDFVAGGFKYSGLREDLPSFLDTVERGARDVETVAGILHSHSGKTVAKTATSVDLNSVVEEMALYFTETARKSGLTVSLDLQREIREVSAAYDDVQQILVNLVLNACQHASRGVARAVSIATTDSGSDPCVVCTISDGGPGIPQEVVDCLHRFEVDMEDAGCIEGMGLKAVLCVLQRHSGGWSIEANKNAGCRFSFWLPAAGGR